MVCLLESKIYELSQYLTHILWLMQLLHSETYLINSSHMLYVSIYIALKIS